MPPRSAFYQHYGLWYDRRRVDHNYYGSPEQRTGDVWAPFMELPWARAAQGKAWDGLSRYDLRRFNPWYFERIEEFADDRRPHGAHPATTTSTSSTGCSRADRTTSTSRGGPSTRSRRRACRTRSPPPTPSTTSRNPLRRELHRRYIRHCARHPPGPARTSSTASTASTPVRSSSSGSGSTRSPSGSANTGQRLFVALEIPKDQMDAILDDPVRGPMVAAIRHPRLDVPCRRSALRRARRHQPRARGSSGPTSRTPEEREALKTKLGVAPLDQKDFLNGPEFSGSSTHCGPVRSR